MVNVHFKPFDPPQQRDQSATRALIFNMIAVAKGSNMNTYLDAKTMAKTLRNSLLEREFNLSHSDCLELVAHQFGLENWNILAAKIDTANIDQLRLPTDWFITSQTNTRHYQLGLDPEMINTVLIRSRFSAKDGDLEANSFGCLMQSVMAEEWRGQRLHLTASLQTKSADSAAIWMRIDNDSGKTLRFDNMLKRPNGTIKGTNAWRDYSIVLDVPIEAETIHFGFLLSGYGQVWAKSFQLQTVGENVSPTAVNGRVLAKPSNLNFT